MNNPTTYNNISVSTVPIKAGYSIHVLQADHFLNHIHTSAASHTAVEVYMAVVSVFLMSRTLASCE